VGLGILNTNAIRDGEKKLIGFKKSFSFEHKNKVKGVGNGSGNGLKM
jgi:hypothetical protein